jgi:O-antigen biosynthesis alpha-1,2-rhamnosyltransferase
LKRFLIECTHVFEHPAHNSGIQRVVRNIVRELEFVATPYEFIPVIIRSNEVRKVLSLGPINVQRPFSVLKRWAAKLDYMRDRLWFFHSRVERFGPFSASKILRTALLFVTKVTSVLMTFALRGLLLITRRNEGLLRSSKFEVLPGDQLVLLDSSWHASSFDLVSLLKYKGVGVIGVVYDLIPLTHPQFFPEKLVQIFERWFEWVATAADGFVSISSTVSIQLQTEILSRHGLDVAKRAIHSHFRLGSDLDLISPESFVDEGISHVFSSDESVYLMVGTIEPRKNHTYLLNAFEILWSRGSSVRLCIVGNVGWKCEELLARIRSHCEFEKRLFIFNRVSDASLNYAYVSARALVFPSHVEGFGLPLVEALQRGLPVFASDIPVFREVGGEFLTYFDLDNPNNLADAILEFESSGVFSATGFISEWQWPSWREATQEFVDRLVAMQKVTIATAK